MDDDAELYIVLPVERLLGTTRVYKLYYNGRDAAAFLWNYYGGVYTRVITFPAFHPTGCSSALS